MTTKIISCFSYFHIDIQLQNQNNIISVIMVQEMLQKALKAYQYRIYPSKEQAKLFSQHFGASRWVYNWGLDLKKKHFEETKKNLSKRSLQDELVALKKTEEKAWLTEVNSQSLLASLAHLDSAFSNFFAKRAAFPNFKKKYSGRQSYQCPQHVSVDIENKLLHLPKIKNVKINLHRPFSGKIKTCTVTKSATGKYYISLLVEKDEVKAPQVMPTPHTTLGIDLGIASFATLNTGEKIQNSRYHKKQLKKLKSCQRKLSKKIKRSANYAKARKRLAKIHEKVTDQRKNQAHQVSAKLVYKSQDALFAVESLNVKGLVKNRSLSREIADCGWNAFINCLKYKAEWAGKQVLEVDRFYPSSKICSNCTHYKSDLKLSMRIYDCSCCGSAMDRDMNAAINLKKFALEQIGTEWAEFKPGDHALTGMATSEFNGMKQEAATRILI
ncbi:MAG: Mobile element protein [Chlamydiales bacterium]|nr:Mobile element protein [Chlamydiales bacterium]